MKHKPTAEQEAIIQAARTQTASLMIKAYAGCAKTTTLEMLAAALPPSPALALAFNVKIKKELELRFPPHFKIMTLNGLGHSAWQRAVGRALTVDATKLGKLVTSEAKKLGMRLGTDEWTNVREMVTKAMQVGLVPTDFADAKVFVVDHPDEWKAIADDCGVDDRVQGALVPFARQVLIQSIKMSYAGIISFDDQIYMSALFGGIFPRFGLVMVDEAQDLSLLNHVQVALAAAGRLIVVGDDKQAIYAFRGADSASMARLRKLRKEWIDLPLATTFRCPKVIVARNVAHAPGFVAFDTAPDGEFRRVPMLRRASPAPEEAKPETVTHGDLPPSGDDQRQQPGNAMRDAPAAWRWAEVADGADNLAVLCRNNAPLLSMAFKLLRQGIPVVMLGRDIGKGLVALATKLAPDDLTPTTEVRVKVEDWLTTERSKAIANQESETKIDSIVDRGECLKAVIDSGNVKNAGELRTALKALFEREHGRVTLASGHRAKGLEWHTVVHLDPWRVPGKWALRAGGAVLEQEYNLKYVIETRAKSVLIEANLEEFET